MTQAGQWPKDVATQMSASISHFVKEGPYISRLIARLHEKVPNCSRGIY